jgi:hypothetical protein
MAYPYPTINEKRAYENQCILPHKALGITTYSQCVAAMAGCQRQSEEKFRRTGNATYAHFATTFNKSAHDDRLARAAVGASAAADASAEYEYHGACKLLLSDCGRHSLWPAARDQMVHNLKRYHAGQPPVTRADMPTLSCSMRADGTFACTGNTFTRSLPLHLSGAPEQPRVVWHS